MFVDFTNKFRQQLDDNLLQQKKKAKGKVQQVGSDKGKKGASESASSDSGRSKEAQAGNKDKQGKGKNDNKQQQVGGGRAGANSAGANSGGRSTDKGGAEKDFKAEAKNGRGYENNKGRSSCPKCRDPGHNGYGCPYFEGAPAPSICKECHLEGRHWPEDCPFRRKRASNASASGKEGAGGKDRNSKN